MAASGMAAQAAARADRQERLPVFTLALPCRMRFGRKELRQAIAARLGGGQPHAVGDFSAQEHGMALAEQPTLAAWWALLRGHTQPLHPEEICA